MRGKRPGAASNVENLKAQAPASIRPGDGRGAVRLGNGAAERDIDVALALHRLRLGAQQLAVPDRLGIVIRHVDQGRDAAGRGGARGAAEPVLIGLAAGIDLSVDHARHHPLAAGIDLLARGRRRAASHESDFAVRHRHEPVVDDAVCESPGCR